MENDRKVFSSNIIRSNNKSKNNLRDILNIVPVQPLPKTTASTTINVNCDFVPKCDKFYLPKKKNCRKVKTVRDIRNAFQKDVYSDLPIELEKQRNTLLRKIRFGSSRDDKTKEIANDMLKSGNPMSKSTWQMLMNINPEGHKFSSQYILWKGKCIQINGSKGGQNKFISKYDVEKVKQSCYKQSIAKGIILNRKRKLLHHSLNIKFKPGPLTKKKDLDTSYQKYQFGEIELISLPQPGLEIQSSYGKPLAPAIDTFLHKTFFENDNGIISSKWAKFAVSVLGRNKSGIVHQISEDSCVTFDLNYKCSQHRLLMRHDSDIINKVKHNENTRTCPLQEEDSIMSQIKNIMDKVINAVEISLKQNELYSGEDRHPEITIANTISTNSHSNNKTKRKLGELGRLDVTVIRISDTAEVARSAKCQNDYCALGCVCDSLECSYNLRRHCGQVECMFKCKCDFSKYQYKDSLDSDSCSDIIPGLINLDKRLCQTLAKEEHKFHQTVIVTDERSILLKSKKRNWKTSKKYADFYSNMRLKTDHNTTQMLSIVCGNLNCKNIEPWCMVHNLYKCFCRGKFTEAGYTGSDEIKIDENDKAIVRVDTITSDSLTVNENNCETTNGNIRNNHTNSIKASLRNRVRYSMPCNQYVSKESVSCANEENDVLCVDSCNGFCARTQTYNGRKFHDEYYYNTNKKILEMEKNDKTLHKKMMRLVQNGEIPDNDVLLQNTNVNSSSSLKELLSNVIIEHNSNESDVEQAKRLPNKAKLVAWLEWSYKQYRQRLDQGFAKVSLDPPKAGKLCLYSWDFILNRYRERKNYFLISKQKPFRIFMAIDINNSLFDDCTNISDINLTDIDNYPITVKNLITNASDLKENFCILCGLFHCWELIGSVTKVNENKKPYQDENTINKTVIPEGNCSQLHSSDVKYDFDNLLMSIEDCTDKIEKDLSNQESQLTCDGEYDLENLPICIEDCLDTTEKGIRNEVSSTQDHDDVLSKIPMSKWFVMKVENDFSEIQFYRKGFFVKYESVVKAINVARFSGKTVRLSSQKFNNEQTDPQFGIYAIPSSDELCVFIGPYEKDENLGIETIKKMQTPNIHIIPQFRTRGIWILTNKIDNLKVVDNPLLFISSSCLHNDKMVTLESDSFCNYNTSIPEIPCNVRSDVFSQPKINKEIVSKQVKPIKIRKTNGFYHLTTNGYLKPISSPDKDVINKPLLFKTNVADFKSRFLKFTPPKTAQNLATKRNSKRPNLTPATEIAPQIDEHSSNVLEKQNKKLERGMFVLKPEEINKRAFETTLLCEQLKHASQNSQNIISGPKDEITMDIENFLATSMVCSSPKEEVFIISDDENESRHCAKRNMINDVCKNIWIICKNVENLGWITGKKNSKNYISFEFPGFRESQFYPESEALKKICQIYARKVYVPRHIQLEWHVTESEAEVKTIKKLEAKHLCADYILTKRGLRHKFEVAEKFKSLKSSKPSALIKAISSDHKSLDEDLIKEKCEMINDLEETSQILEDESSFLWDRTLSNQGEILQSFSRASEELRKELTKQLNAIKSDSED